MKERGKALETYNNFSDFNYSVSDMPCRKHPNSSSVGICPHCLRDRLVNLVCSECGEQRLSSCSCSDISSSYRNSCSTMDVGSVGRISFLIENEKTEQNPNPRRKGEQTEEVILLRRSSSSCVEIKKSNGIWKIKRLFRKKKKQGVEKNVESDEKSEIWVSDLMGVSRSRSLCSFRGNGLFNDPDEGSDYAYSSAKISDVTSGVFMDYNESEPRKSGFRGMFDFDSGIPDFKAMKKNPPLELDRAQSVPHRSVYPVKESDFNGMDESAFIDLKLDSSADSRTDFCFSSSSARISTGVSSDQAGSLRNSTCDHGNLKNNLVFGNGGSCRITVNEKGLKRGSKGHKVWKWIFRHHHTASKKEEQVQHLQKIIN